MTVNELLSELSWREQEGLRSVSITLTPRGARELRRSIVGRTGWWRRHRRASEFFGSVCGVDVLVDKNLPPNTSVWRAE